MEYIIIDALTSNCLTGFDSKDAAYQFIIDHTKPGDSYSILTSDNYQEEMEIEDGSMKLVVAPMEWVDDENEAELIIGEGPWDSHLNEVATFKEDLLVMDILESINVPVRCYRE